MSEARYIHTLFIINGTFSNKSVDCGCMSIVIEGPEGKREFPEETLLIFIDETGVEDMTDPNAPFFGFGGCLCPVPNYSSWIEDPWNEVQNLFPEETLPLHAADLRPNNLSEKQLEAISNFFVTRNFQCFAAVASNQIMNETEENLFHILATQTYQLISNLTQHIRGIDFQQVVMMFEHSQKLDKFMADYFQRYNFKKGNGVRVPTFYCTMTKQAKLASGLIVADFVAHTAGAQTRARINGASGFRRDFEAVFRKPNQNKSSFIEVTRVTKVA